jgi:hypothetical protein
MDRWLSSIDMIRYAIADEVRTLGGSEQDVQRISTTAACAIWSWGFAEAQGG